MKIKHMCAYCGDYYYSELTDESKPFIKIDKEGEKVVIFACFECYNKPCNEFEIPPEVIDFIGRLSPNFLITSNGTIRSIPKQTTLKIGKNGKIEIIMRQRVEK